MGPISIGIVAVTLICLMIFAAISVAGVLGEQGRREW